MKKTFPCIWLILIFLFPMKTMSQSIEEGMQNLTEQISKEMSLKEKQRIAVIEFSDLDGNISEFGQFVSEELITRLYLTNKFKVIERQLFNKVLEEQKLSSTGLIDPSVIKSLGKLLGVDAICSGTISDLGNYVKLNGRLISTETGTLFAVAAAEIVKNDVVSKLISKINNPTIRIDKAKEPDLKQKPDYFFYEDFNEVSEGAIPAEWYGGDKMVVGRIGRSKALYLSANPPKSFGFPSRKTTDMIFTKPILFPKNFRLEIIVSIPNTCWGEIHVTLGLVSFGNKCLQATFNNDEIRIPIEERLGNKAIFVLEKKDNIYTTYINQKRYHLKRLSINFNQVQSMRIEITGYSKESVMIHRITGKKL